jgi:hypothetical protein
MQLPRFGGFVKFQDDREGYAFLKTLKKHPTTQLCTFRVKDDPDFYIAYHSQEEPDPEAESFILNYNRVFSGIRQNFPDRCAPLEVNQVIQACMQQWYNLAQYYKHLVKYL